MIQMMPHDPAIEIIDLPELAKQLGGNASLARGLLSDCADELPALMSTIRQAAERGDSHGLAREAHAIKGIFANLRLPALRAAATALETAASAGSHVTDGAVDRLEREAERFRKALPGIPA
jgi:HPt (histidine-containing phosphotransfer) domain-containing protein